MTSAEDQAGISAYGDEAKTEDRPRFLLGRRKDNKGWDVLVVGSHVEYVGPFRLQREAKAAIALGDARIADAFAKVRSR